MLPLLLFAVATAAPPAETITEAAHAVAAGRLEQARSMINAAVARGASGAIVDRVLADLAFASGDDGEALVRYRRLLEKQPDDPELLERAATAALRLHNIVQAKVLAVRATAVAAPSWRAWNVRGVIADLEQDFETADSSYLRALALAPDRAEVLNNIGWSRLLRGDWQGAIEPLESAAAKLPRSHRAINNLELARTATESDLPQRRPGETDHAWASRLNDAGVAARLRGERARAIAAFARAIEVRGSWYRRAANNLAEANEQK